MLRKFTCLIFTMLLTSPVAAQAKVDPPKPVFDFNNLNMTSNYLWLWRTLLYTELDKAQRSGNDLAYTELKKRFDERMQDFSDRQFRWAMRFKGIVNGAVQLETDYKYKSSSLRVVTSPIFEADLQNPESWMAKLRRGDSVMVEGTVKSISMNDFPVITITKWTVVK